ncbi:helix-turn-helix domain-containing protein [Hymenobacter fodinae]|uniref:DNA-binding protein n=1 Tax=Hymenobacter fodinae TaxID=2510796 RepID=A0A4Z0PCK6_9BACT|nr:helix-turn-helix domain-containing protein [Hymenobacter fodinae]TGE09948.1 DNA-binding protein [Hymenobacter fodinae]
MSTLITASVGYPQLLDEFSRITREILLELLPSTAPAAEVGGIELAIKITQLSKARIYALCSSRNIPHCKRGNKLYFNRADLLTWLAEGKREVKTNVY